MKKNPLLTNMINKIKIIDGSIDMCKKLKQGETIEVNGLHRIAFSRGEHTTDDQIDETICKLMVERIGLAERVCKMDSSVIF